MHSTNSTESHSPHPNPQAPLSSSAPSSNLIILTKLQSSNFEVYLAKNKHTNNFIALKIFPVINEDLLNPKYITEKALLPITHPNIVKFLAFSDRKTTLKNGHYHTTSVIFMEAAPYGDLTSLIFNEQLSLNEKLIRSIFRQIIDGLGYLHERELAHLDIKCDNILIGDDFVMKLCDFGDCEVAEGGQKLTSPIGTRLYMAPELMKEQAKVKDLRKADVFSAGVVLFALAIGQFPFIENEGNDGYHMIDLLSGNPKKYWDIYQEFSSKVGLLSDEFKEICQMMLSENPEERATLEEVKDSSWFKKDIYEKEDYQNRMEFYCTKGKFFSK